MQNLELPKSKEKSKEDNDSLKITDALTTGTLSNIYPITNSVEEEKKINSIQLSHKTLEIKEDDKQKTKEFDKEEEIKQDLLCDKEQKEIKKSEKIIQYEKMEAGTLKKPTKTDIMDLYEELHPKYEMLQNNANTKTSVYLVRLNDGREFVLKTRYVKSAETKILMDKKARKKVDDLVREYYISRTFGKISNNTVKAIDMKQKYFESDKAECIEILWEYGGVNLTKICQNIDYHELMDITYQLIDVLATMEEIGIAHFDLKPENIVYEKPVLKIIDFGVAMEFYRSSHEVAQMMGKNRDKIRGYTISYAPPEILKFEKTRNIENTKNFIPQKIDAFCFGMTFVFLWVKGNVQALFKLERDNLEDHTEFIKMLDKEEKGYFKGDFPEIIKSCLAFSPELRPDFKKVRNEFEQFLEKKTYSDIITKNKIGKINLSSTEIAQKYLEINENEAAIYHLKKILETMNYNDEIDSSHMQKNEEYNTNEVSKTVNKKLDEQKRSLINKEKCEQFRQIFMCLGEASRKQGNLEASKNYYIQAIHTMKKVYDEDHSELASIYGDLGIVYADLGQYQTAIEFYTKSININKKVFGEEYSNLALTYSNVGLVYDKLGKYELAIEFYDKSIKIYKKCYGEDDAKLASIYCNYGLVSEKLGKNETSIEFYTKSMNILKKVYTEEPPELATTYINLGDVYANTGKLDIAIEFYTKSMNISKKFYGNDHPELAVIYTSLGLAYGKLGKYVNAYEFFTESMNINNKFYSEEHLQLAKDNNNLGLVYFQLGKYKESIEYYTKSVIIYKKHYGEEHPDLALSYRNLASVYDKIGKYETAIELLNKSIKINKKFYGEENPELATAYSEIGLVYQSVGKFDSAIEFYNKSININKKTYGEEYPELAVTYGNLGSVYYEIENYEMSILFHTKDLDIAKKVYGEEHPDVASSYNNLGLVYQSLGKFETAIEFYTKAVNITKKVQGEKTPKLALMYNNIGLVHNELGKYEIAIEYYNKSININKEFFSEKNPELALPYSNLGLAFDNLGMYEKSLEWYSLAESISLEFYGPDHPFIIKLYQNMAIVFKKMGNNYKAKQYLNKIIY